MPPQEDAYRISHSAVEAAPILMDTTNCSISSSISHGSISNLARDQQTLEDLRDVIHALKDQEAAYAIASGLHCFPLYFDSWRPVMVSWMYSVIDTFALNPLCVPTGMYYLDTCCRMLPNNNAKATIATDGNNNSKKEMYPLMAMTALNLAIKCHETRMFPLDQLVLLLGRGKQVNSGQEQMRYTPEDIVEMERTLLKECQWRLHPATTHDFLHQFVQVLDESTRDDVLERAMTHLKNALMWEHVLHQQLKQHRQQKQPAQFQPFLPSTLAYASLLLAMEDMQLPLADKQACCLALLQVADMSTHTPHLSKAYNWLVYAKNLQAQLVAANERQHTSTMPATPVPAADGTTRVVSPTTTATISTGQVVPATKADFQPPLPATAHQQPTSMAAPVAVVSPTAITASAKTSVTMEDASSTAHGAMVVEETTVSIKANAWQKQSHFRHPSVVEDDPLFAEDNEGDDQEDTEEEGDDNLSEVIFYSHTYTGDGFEVMAVDMDSGDDEEAEYANPLNTNLDPSLLASPASTELSVADLILTESLDEDGFEVSYANSSFHSGAERSWNKQQQLANMLASPTDVVA
jgi:Cyclin, N-terminal domain